MSARVKIVHDIPRGFKFFPTKDITFYQFFKSNPLPTLISTAEEGVVVDINAPFLKLFNYRCSEVIGKRLMDFSFWAGPESWKARLLARRAEKDPGNSFTTIITKDGELREVLVLSNRISQKGKNWLILSFCALAEYPKNRNKVQKLKKEYGSAEDNFQDGHKWFQILFKNSIDCLYLRDLEGHFIDLNDAALRLMGYTREEFTSLKFETLAGEENLAKISEAIKEREQPGFEDKLYEYKLRRKDGSYVYIEATGFPLLRAGKPYAILGIGRDITERKKAEELLKKREEELEIKTIHLEESNAALKVLLREREKDRNDLEEKIITNIRETIKPYVEKLQSTPLGAHQKAYVDIIGSSLDKIISPFLQKIKSQYLNFTQTEIRITGLILEGKNSKEIADMMNVSERAIEFHRNNIRAKLGIRNKKTTLRTYLLYLQ
jgi:PAS domain S-box-containing protein